MFSHCDVNRPANQLWCSSGVAGKARAISVRYSSAGDCMSTIDPKRSAIAALNVAAVAVAILFFSAVGAAVAALLV
jgi:hypothetical protein